ncbi:hypothetical protein N0B51_00305 [Tsuneonella sp. YG55]|uniref:Uncharacterized protein n=1 Tax=Tsuneonella litorea TaxID=2976475 RepID=A0A9X2VZR7_9SPHN|nr:hypothetical protein [Tsuneonella litorea]MCT2557411.1 hypothetical protein [Tsuneonella litorea]
MRIIQRLNPGPGIADFWTEFKRPNPYRWPILAGSTLLTGSLLFLLTDRAVSLNWIAGGALALVGGGALAAMIAERVKIRLGILLLASIVPAFIFWQFVKERWRIPPPPPEVTYISTFEAGRSDDEIAASNRVNQARQDRLRAEQARREEEARDAYRALGRASGLDVDAMERRIAQQEAAERAAGRADDRERAVARPPQ